VHDPLHEIWSVTQKHSMQGRHTHTHVYTITGNLHIYIYGHMYVFGM
jgi:hypothetical protein